MLDPQVLMDLLLKLAVRMNLIRHGNFLDKSSSQKAVRLMTIGSLALTLLRLRVRGIFYCYSGGDPSSLFRGSCKQERHSQKRESRWFGKGDREQIGEARA
jgi:hypothetical protein